MHQSIDSLAFSLIIPIAMSTSHYDSTQKREIITSHSTLVGFRTSAVAAACAGAAVLAANKYSPLFRSRLGVSGKVGLVTMAGICGFIIPSENELLRGSRNPDQFIAQLEQPTTANAPAVVLEKKHLPLYQQFGNLVHDHPFRVVASSAVPMVGMIFLYQNHNHNIQFSQKIMHTRIYGQGLSVVLLLSTMAIYDYMSRRGPFE
ncbi:unnamed protein product [Aphanomyces euteiches]